VGLLLMYDLRLNSMFLALGVWFVMLLPVPTLAEGSSAIFAEVNGVKLMQVEYDSALHVASRERFFHAEVDEAALYKLRLDVAQQLIDRQIILQRAKSLALEVDASDVSAGVDAELKRYRLAALKDEQVVRLKKLVLIDVRERLLLDQVKQQVKQSVVITESQVREFYRHNLDKFTTPEQVRVSVILLNVAPSSLPPVWKAAQEEAERLRARLLSGADFVALASIHSSDSSSGQGGDLGFVHKGMLSKEAQSAVDGLNVGELSPAVVLLQGVSLFKLVDKRAAKVNIFEDVATRAESLLRRDMEQVSWGAYLQVLRDEADVTIHDKRIIGLM